MSGNIGGSGSSISRGSVSGRDNISIGCIIIGGGRRNNGNNNNGISLSGKV